MWTVFEEIWRTWEKAVLSSQWQPFSFFSMSHSYLLTCMSLCTCTGVFSLLKMDQKMCQLLLEDIPGEKIH